MLKAIAHDPRRRYATAGDLAEDLRRFLADWPVWARRSRLPERLWRWCRRNPAVASLIAVIALLLVVVAVGSSLSAWSLRIAEREAREKLWHSKLNEARVTVQSQLPGKRFTSLKRIREALAIAQETGLTEEDQLQMRNAAIAALALADFEIVGEAEGINAKDIDFRPKYYTRVDKEGRISVRRICEDQEIANLAGTNQPISLCLSPDGRYLAVCPNSDQENGLSILDWPSGRELFNFPAPELSPLGFDKDDALWTGRDQGKVLRWPRSANSTNGAIRLGPPELVTSVPDAKACALHPDGQALVLCNGYQGALILSGRPSGKILPTGRQDDIRHAAISPDGQLVATGSHWGSQRLTAKIWDAQTGRLVKAFPLRGLAEYSGRRSVPKRPLQRSHRHIQKKPGAGQR